MLDRFRAFVAEHQLIPDGARVLVGYSGGADSTCLLHLLHRSKVDCIAAYLHHGQRQEADAELEACRAFAESLGVPFVSGKADVPLISKERKFGLEEAGREARYAFLNEAAAQTGCHVIVTAHTRTDLAETVLLNLVRGSGLAGLGGIPMRRGKVVRPLLAFTREETESYCRANGFETVQDPSNVDPQFSRARIRSNVFPELRAINASVEAAIARLAGIARDEDEFLDAAAAAALEQCEVPLNGELAFLTKDAEIKLRRSYLLHLPPVLLKRSIRLLVEALGGTLDHEVTIDAASRFASEEKGSLTAEGGKVVLTWKAEHLFVNKKGEEKPFKSALRVPGDTICDSEGWLISACLSPYSGQPLPRNALNAFIDVNCFRGPLHFRNPQAGDRQRPTGAQGHRKLSDLMGEAKLSLLARKRLPIICDIIGPIWAPGVALDERARVTPGSKQALLMVFAPISSEAG